MRLTGWTSRACFCQLSTPSPEQQPCGKQVRSCQSNGRLQQEETGLNRCEQLPSAAPLCAHYAFTVRRDTPQPPHRAGPGHRLQLLSTVLDRLGVTGNDSHNATLFIIVFLCISSITNGKRRRKRIVPRFARFARAEKRTSVPFTPIIERHETRPDRAHLLHSRLLQDGPGRTRPSADMNKDAAANPNPNPSL